VLISVIIATHNRSVLLARTLDAIGRQRWPRESMEVLVADNGSTDGTPAVVEAARAAGLPVRYLFERRSGKSYAVNAALALARGDLIAFTDDDVQPEPEWLGALGHAIDQPGVDFVAGRILPIWECPPPDWMSPALHGVLAVRDNGTAPRPISTATSGVMPIGANMAVRSDVIAKIGGLRTDLGKLEGSLRTGEDHEFFLRLLHGGYRGTYEPSALVHHLVPASRLHRGYFGRWLFQNGSDVARIDRSYASSVPLLLGVPRYLWRQAGADIVTTVAPPTGGGGKAFASALRALWFVGYLRESWLGRTAAGKSTLTLAHHP
jgi:glycosyltransferase involved in cell wall biosynthesis